MLLVLVFGFAHYCGAAFLAGLCDLFWLACRFCGWLLDIYVGLVV